MGLAGCVTFNFTASVCCETCDYECRDYILCMGRCMYHIHSNSHPDAWAEREVGTLWHTQCLLVDLLGPDTEDSLIKNVECLVKYWLFFYFDYFCERNLVRCILIIWSSLAESAIIGKWLAIGFMCEMQNIDGTLLSALFEHGLDWWHSRREYIEHSAIPGFVWQPEYLRILHIEKISLSSSWSFTVVFHSRFL